MTQRGTYPIVDPQTPEDWQTAVNLAEVLLLVDSARQYGLITGGPAIHADRCAALLEAARSRGIVPEAAAVDTLVRKLTGGA